MRSAHAMRSSDTWEGSDERGMWMLWLSRGVAAPDEGLLGGLVPLESCGGSAIRPCAWHATKRAAVEGAEERGATESSGEEGLLRPLTSHELGSDEQGLLRPLNVRVAVPVPDF
mmetsp:Transcript_85999/g.171758  ORF Transcript_85999/g.171758 Transcript_85999/m.171758 type:complete len:114 (+) Transcript_85999:1112-1453(+)